MKHNQMNIMINKSELVRCFLAALSSSRSLVVCWLVGWLVGRSVGWSGDLCGGVCEKVTYRVSNGN